MNATILLYLIIFYFGFAIDTISCKSSCAPGEKIIPGHITPSHNLNVEKKMENSPQSTFQGGVLCAGLACLDMQLIGATKMDDPEAINTFQKTVYCAGGSAPMTSSSLGHLGMPSVGALVKLGKDLHADEMIRQLNSANVDTTLCLLDSVHQTSLSVLPIFQDGARACWVELGANDSLTKEEICTVLREHQEEICQKYKAFHFGYPHLLQNIQGENLKDLLQSVKDIMGNPLISIDLNGVDPEKHSVPDGLDVLGPALPFIDILHANLEEAHVITGEPRQGTDEEGDAYLQRLTTRLVEQGLGIAAITLGAEGAYVRVTNNAERIAASPMLEKQAEKWLGECCKINAYAIGQGSSVNANGAGDAFIGGLVGSLLVKKTLSLPQATKFALQTALQRVDSKKRESPLKESAEQILNKVLHEET